MANEEFNPTVCTQTLEEHNFKPVCPQPHCAEFQESEIYHADCAKSYIYQPVQSLGCYNTATGEWKFGAPETIGEECLELIQKDRSWKIKNCYCCCSCFANQTPIGLPGGAHRAISELRQGDIVLSGSPEGNKVVWKPAPVKFSQGTLGGEEPAMVYIVYGDGLRLIASTDQVLMLADGTLTTAGRLVPGQRLLGSENEPLEVQLASIGGYVGGVHHIATETEWTGSVDHHLISANGVVSGDFTLQLYFPSVSAELKVADWESLPTIGTPEYARVHSHLTRLGEAHSYAAPGNEIELQSEEFVPYKTLEAEPPAGAQAFLTARQAQDIVENGKQQAISNRSGYPIAQAAIALVSGFYREFTYYLDWERNEPNVYAFEQYGEKIVLVTGGLARMQGLSFEGLTMAVAHGVARFVAGAPKTGSGYACTGQADLYAFGVISQTVWFGEPWLGETMAAIEQLKELFALINEEDAQPNPLDICDEPGIACRTKTWMTALAGGSLPECAGGPTKPALRLEQATASGSKVTLVFNQSPTAESAKTIANYALDPAAKITAVSIDAEEDFKVELTVEDLEQGAYAIEVSNLTSTYGGKLEPNPTTGHFQVGA